MVVVRYSQEIQIDCDNVSCVIGGWDSVHWCTQFNCPQSPVSGYRCLAYNLLSATQNQAVSSLYTTETCVLGFMQDHNYCQSQCFGGHMDVNIHLTQFTLTCKA